MAFNPFHRFRKHQKVIFAALTILCMLTFVLAGSMSGIGNWLEEMPYWFGGSSKRNPAVANIYGQDVRAMEMNRLYRVRQMTNRFMDDATMSARTRPVQEAEAPIKKWTDTKNKQYLEQILQFYFQIPQYGDQLLAQLAGRLQQEGKKTEAAQVQNLKNALQVYLEKSARAQRGEKGEMFFGATDKYDVERLVDFLIWRHEADRLGIQLTPEAVSQLVSQELDKQLTNNDLGIIEQRLRREFGVSSEEFLAGLADEFRVRIAQSTLLGQEPGLKRVREGIPPYEVWQWYRENFTWGNYTLLPIPVDQPEFLSQVGQPDEKELKELFEKYKSRAYDPASAEPGFEQPARVGVEWVGARTDAPRYRQAAAATLAATEATMPLAYAARLSDRYEATRWRYHIPPLTQYYDIFYLHASLAQPANVAALVGQLAGAGATRLPVYATPISYEGGVVAREVKQRAEVGTTLWLALSNPTPFTAAGVQYYLGKREEHLPFATVKDMVVREVEEDLAKKFVTQALSNVRQDLEDNLSQLKTAEDVRSFQQVNRPEHVAGVLALVGGSAASGGPAYLSLAAPAAVGARDGILDRVRSGFTWFAGIRPFSLPGANVPYQEAYLPPAVVRAALDREIRQEGLLHGATEKPDDVYTIAKDPGLKPLENAYAHSLQVSQGPKGPQLEELFFDVKTAQPKIASAYKPRPLDTEDGSASFLYWTTKEEPAYVPTFEEARERVAARWRLEKARKFAEEKAEELAKKVGEAKGDPLPVLRDLSYSHPSWGALVELEHVVPLQKHPIAHPTPLPMMQYDPYQPPSSVEYPADDLVSRLLQLKQKGETTVVNNKPKTIYYVAALVTDRSSPPENSFYQDYASPMERQQMLGRLEEQNKFAAQQQQAVLLRLREEAKVHILKQERKEEAGDQS